MPPGQHLCMPTFFILIDVGCWLAIYNILMSSFRLMANDCIISCQQQDGETRRGCSLDHVKGMFFTPCNAVIITCRHKLLICKKSQEKWHHKNYPTRFGRYVVSSELQDIVVFSKQYTKMKELNTSIQKDL